MPQLIYMLKSRRPARGNESSASMARLFGKPDALQVKRQLRRSTDWL